MYRAVCQWRDLSDGHLYETGEVFPHDGRDISPERIAQLTSGRNKAKKALIAACEPQDEESTIPAPETRQKAAKTARKRKGKE